MALTQPPSWFNDTNKSVYPYCQSPHLNCQEDVLSPSLTIARAFKATFHIFLVITLPFSFLGLDFQSYLSGLDFLPQLTTAFPVKRNPVGSSTQGIRSSPLHALVGSPIKEEEEHPETDTKKTNLGKQETKEALKQVYCAHCCYECSF